MLKSIYLCILLYVFIRYLKKHEELVVVDAYRKDIVSRNTVRELWTSFIYTFDVVSDWIFVLAVFQEVDDEDLRIPALIFASLGTFLFFLDTFDVLQWISWCPSGKGWIVTLCNIVLEDLPQLIITSIAGSRRVFDKKEKFTSAMIINLMTSGFALITKIVALYELYRNKKEDFTFPNLYNFVKENPQLAQWMADEELSIFPCQLERIQKSIVNYKINKHNIRMRYILVETTVPGGVFLITDYLERSVHATTHVTFAENSKINMQEVCYLVSRMDLLEKAQKWFLDLSNCHIGGNTPKVIFKEEFHKQVVEYGSNNFFGNNFFGIQLLLRQIGCNGLQHEIRVFPKNARKLLLNDVIFDKYTCKGICRVLEYSPHIEMLFIVNLYDNGTAREDAKELSGILATAMEENKLYTLKCLVCLIKHREKTFFNEYFGEPELKVEATELVNSIVVGKVEKRKNIIYHM